MHVATATTLGGALTADAVAGSAPTTPAPGPSSPARSPGRPAAGGNTAARPAARLPAGRGSATSGPRSLTSSASATQRSSR
eukprot:5648015-Lingulodinium_polyedra.AAC.1